MSDLERFMQKITKKEDGCWYWNKPRKKDNYGTFKLGKTQYAHRVSYILFVGEIPPGLCVCHKCDVPRCVNPEHLFLGTSLDNTRDRISKGREGGSFPTKLSAGEVRMIRALHSKGSTQVALAKQFNITQPCVSYIVNGINRKRVL